jgi:hypothetical protein
VHQQSAARGARRSGAAQKRPSRRLINQSKPQAYARGFFIGDYRDSLIPSGN